jgi:hypothetical protein
MIAMRTSVGVGVAVGIGVGVGVGRRLGGVEVQRASSGAATTSSARSMSRLSPQ